MTAEFNFDTNEVLTEWLTTVLTENGYLDDGEITHADQQRAALGQGSAATFYHLSLRYSASSRGDKPESMLLKVAKPGETESFEPTLEIYAAYQLIPQAKRYDLIQKEPAFYETVRKNRYPLPLIECYGSAIDQGGHQNCLLLQDMSANWCEPLFPLPPSEKACTNTVEALAQIHAHWWDSDHFDGDELPRVSDAVIDEAISIYRSTFDEFARNMGDRLSLSRRDIYLRALDALPRLLKYRFHQSDVTLVHGDAHHWNVFVHNETEETVLYDWQTWHVDCGAHDLGYLISLGWFSERRHRLEQHMLRVYQRHLALQNVTFEFARLEANYRLSIVRHLFTPILLSRLLHPAVWWPQIDRIFSSFEDWQCADLV